VRGDFGKSLAFGSPALGLLVQRLPATAELAGASMLIVVLVGVPTGIVAAVRQGRMLDRLVMLLAVLGQSMATFWLGIMLILFFAVNWHLFPPSGRGSLRHLVLPAVTLAMYLTAVIARLTRSGMLEVLREDFVRTARAKGIGELRVVGWHAFANTLIPIVTILGVQIGNLLAGAVVTEAVFAWPGIGSLTVEAIYRRDYPLIQAAVLFFAFVYTCINLFTEFLYGYLDPRIRAA
jgi:peptide/nickel transport system permease protein